jgi:four helix bundle protein
VVEGRQRAIPFEPLEEKRIYQRAEALSDRVWEIASRWHWFAKRTVGVQWVDAADSIGANIAEANGRFHPGEVKNFLYYARGSLRETKYWMRRALKRALITTAEHDAIDMELEQLSREINECINYQKRRRSNET